jgi:hypothetical protein
MTQHVHDDAVQKAILEIIKGYINNVNDHRLDEDKLMGEVDNIICEIEEIASACEDGDYELPIDD